MFRLPLCLILWNWLSCVVGFGMLGPANLVFKHVTQCDELVNKVKFGITQKKYNRTMSVMDITVDTPVAIDDNMMLEIKGSVKKEGGYKPGGLYMKEPACKALATLLGELFTDMLHAAGVESCPLPAGQHAAMDYYFDNDDFHVPQVYGEYKTEGQLWDGDVSLLCTLVFYDLIPKS